MCKSYVTHTYPTYILLCKTIVLQKLLFLSDNNLNKKYCKSKFKKLLFTVRLTKKKKKIDIAICVVTIHRNTYIFVYKSILMCRMVVIHRSISGNLVKLRREGG